VWNEGRQFFFKTDKDAPLNRVIAIDLDHPAPEFWQTLIPEGTDKLEFVDFVGGRFICAPICTMPPTRCDFSITMARPMAS
jgi:prolyl oligopeptidase